MAGLGKRRWADNLRCVPHATRSASSHAEVPQLVKKHLSPVVADGYEFPYERWLKNIEQGRKDREMRHTVAAERGS